jgi:hypothetical protein
MMSDNDAPIDPLLHDMEPELDAATEDDTEGAPVQEEPELPERPPEAPDGLTGREPIT